MLLREVREITKKEKDRKDKSNFAEQSDSKIALGLLVRGANIFSWGLFNEKNI